MLAEIIQNNAMLCQFESNFNVVLNRDGAVMQIVNGVKCLNIPVLQWVVPTVATNKRMFNAFMVLEDTMPVKNVVGVVLVNSSTTFTGFEVWDMSSTVLQTSIDVFGSDPTCDPVPPQGIFDWFSKGTVNVKSATKNVGAGTITVKADNDIRLFGFIDIITSKDVEFDVPDL